MRGSVFTGNRQLELRDFPDPTPGPGEVVLELIRKLLAELVAWTRRLAKT